MDSPIVKNRIAFFISKKRQVEFKEKYRKIQTEVEFKKKQLRTREQYVDMIGGEFTKKWESLPLEMKILLAGLSKEEFAKQTSSIKRFSVCTESNTPKKQCNHTPRGATISISIQVG